MTQATIERYQAKLVGVYRLLVQWRGTAAVTLPAAIGRVDSLGVLHVLAWVKGKILWAYLAATTPLPSCTAAEQPVKVLVNTCAEQPTSKWLPLPGRVSGACTLGPTGGLNCTPQPLLEQAFLKNTSCLL